MAKNTNPSLVDQPTKLPSRKVLMSAVAGVLAALINAGLAALLAKYPFFDWLDAPEIRSAVPVVAAAAAGYLFRERAVPGLDQLQGETVRVVADGRPGS